MKRILFIIPAFKHGGTNKSLMNLIPFLSKEFDISIFALSHLGHYKEIFEREVKVIEKAPSLCLLYDSFGSFDFKNDSIKQTLVKFANKLYRKLYKIILRKNGRHRIHNEVIQCIEKMRFDTIVAMQEGSATNFSSKISGKKIAWVRSDYNEYYKIMGINESDIYEKYQSIICVSEYTKNTFLDIYPQFRNKCYAIHNMIDSNKIIEMSNESIDEEKLFNRDYFNIVSIGRLSKVKQFDLIPRIVRELLDSGNKLKWYIIGDGEEKANIYDLIIKNRVENQLFLLGEINNPYPYIKHSDLIVVTSFSEACPNVINESKILHTPVIAINFGSAHEFIKNGVNGVITSKEKIMKDINILIEDEHVYNKIKSNILKFNYSNEIIFYQIVNLLRKE